MQEHLISNDIPISAFQLKPSKIIALNIVKQTTPRVFKNAKLTLSTVSLACGSPVHRIYGFIEGHSSINSPTRSRRSSKATTPFKIQRRKTTLSSVHSSYMALFIRTTIYSIKVINSTIPNTS